MKKDLLLPIMMTTCSLLPGRSQTKYEPVWDGIIIIQYNKQHYRIRVIIVAATLCTAALLFSYLISYLMKTYKNQTNKNSHCNRVILVYSELVSLPTFTTVCF